MDVTSGWGSVHEQPLIMSGLQEKPASGKPPELLCDAGQQHAAFNEHTACLCQGSCDVTQAVLHISLLAHNNPPNTTHPSHAAANSEGPSSNSWTSYQLTSSKHRSRTSLRENRQAQSLLHTSTARKHN